MVETAEDDETDSKKVAKIDDLFEEVKKGLQSELPNITSGTERIEVIIVTKKENKIKNDY